MAGQFACAASAVVTKIAERVLEIEGDGECSQELREWVKLKLERDAFVLVEVVGNKSLYPVVQARSLAPDGSLNEVTPYALTNPVFIDVDGNGRYDAPLPRQIRSLPDVAE